MVCVDGKAGSDSPGCWALAWHSHLVGVSGPDPPLGLGRIYLYQMILGFPALPSRSFQPRWEIQTVITNRTVDVKGGSVNIPCGSSGSSQLFSISTALTTINDPAATQWMFPAQSFPSAQDPHVPLCLPLPTKKSNRKVNRNASTSKLLIPLPAKECSGLDVGRGALDSAPLGTEAPWLQLRVEGSPLLWPGGLGK